MTTRRNNGTDYKKSDGWGRENEKQKFEQEKMSPCKVKPKQKNPCMTKCSASVYLAKEARLIMGMDNLKSGPILAVLGLLEKADREDIYSSNMSYYVNKCLSTLFIACFKFVNIEMVW